MKKAIKLIAALFFTLLSCAMFFTAIGSPQLAIPAFALSVVVFAIVKVPSGNIAFASAISVTDLNTALGAYLREYKDVLISQLLLDDNIRDRVEIMDGVKDEIPLPNLSITDIVRPMDYTAFSGVNNSLVVGARTLKVRDWKVDLLLVPKVLEKTWLGVKSTKGSDPLKLPFEQFLFDYIVKQTKASIRLKAIYGGAYNASGTTSATIFDGFLALVAAEITATNLSAVVTGAITSANVYTKLLLVYDNLAEAYKNEATICPINSQMFDWVVRLFNPISNASIVATDIQTMQSNGKVNAWPLFGTNCTLLREPGLGSSQRIMISKADNFVYGVDSFDDSMAIRVQEYERTLKLMIDGKGGVQFKECRSNAQGNVPLAVNDQA
jgi:hypothetical protein